MKKLNKYLPWTFRVLICLLFIFSAVAKMFPLWAFERQLVGLDIASWCGAHFLSRLIIGFELAIGFAILQPYLLRKVVIPATILLLVVFCIHLGSEMFKNGAMTGNCGCFGELIPMTPLEAFIKNILTIGMLIYLYRNVSEKGGPSKFLNLIFIYSLCAWFMFMAFPFCPCEEQKKVSSDQAVMDNEADIPPVISLSEDTVIRKKVQTDSLSKQKTIAEPKKVKSKFSVYKDFGGKMVNLDEGKKILCLFVPGCDHCREAAKEICSMSKKPGFPGVYIIFMDEESEKIPEFFAETKCNFPHRVINIPEFWDLLGNDGNTPGVIYLWNGNVLKFYEGLQKNKFDAAGLKKAIDKPYP